MTNHSETTGSPENHGIAGDDGREYAGPPQRDRPTSPEGIACTAYDSHGDGQQITLRSPAELADALPYLLGYRPEDSIVLVALHEKDGRGRFGGRARLGIPAGADDWPAAARQLAHGLVTGSERRGARPEQMVVFLCHEPGEGETGRQVKERLGPLAHALRLECGALDIPVVEALCVSGGRFWSYCCDDRGCCPAEGTPLGLPGTSVLAAAATYAGLQIRGSLGELRARLLPWQSPAAREQERALDTAGVTLVPRMLDADGRHEVAGETLGLAERIMGRLAGAAPASGMLPADLRDDDLLECDEAAALILGLQDRTTRDRAAEWMEGDDAGPALRLWRALARRCVGPYGEHAAAPLTLAGWVAWSTGDELEAREALALALAADPDYLFARLLHQACNEGLDPESVRRCLRAERDDRGHAESGDAPALATEPPKGGRGEPSCTGPALPRPVAPPLPRRRRHRAAGSGSGSPRGVRAEGSRPGGRLPYPPASARSTRHGTGTGGGGTRGTRSGAALPGATGPGPGGRRGVPGGGDHLPSGSRDPRAGGEGPGGRTGRPGGGRDE
ncbi:hypothetical protein BU52_07315 [Streptomyces toyocaensis]|uniref:DUF4192 domain-containing protein n=1 Tax=Streptomyces toyocaensis TaxID=55952 RepID=A0A081XW05_STRTO|nr:DUF4192 domain-containing protein [Streptomyces toyocaensis]KES07728.1 hypothetical protein BU52_07315 [Streptomyces toyocaensis]